MARVKFPLFLETEYKSYFLTAHDLISFAIVGALVKIVSDNELLILSVSVFTSFVLKLLTSLLPRGFLPLKFLDLLDSLKNPSLSYKLIKKPL